MSEQKLVTFKINDRELQVPVGTLVIEAAKQIATEVPSFCYYPGLSLQAACRMCLVEVEKMPKLQTACTLVATDGMVVKTDTAQIKQARKAYSNFSSPTTRSIARCATKAASANCRTWFSATAPIPAASSKKKSIA